MTFRQPRSASRKCYGDSQREEDFTQTVQEKRDTELDLFDNSMRTVFLDVMDTVSIQEVVLSGGSLK